MFFNGSWAEWLNGSMTELLNCLIAFLFKIIQEMLALSNCAIYYLHFK